MMTVEKYMSAAARNTAEAHEAFEAGFASKAAQKRASDSANRAYDSLRDAHRVEEIDAAPGQGVTGRDLTEAEYAARRAYFDTNATPFDLHHVRERHIEIFAKLNEDRAAKVRDLVALRTAIKGAEIAEVEPANKPLKELKARVEDSLAELMSRRNAQFLEAVELIEIFKGLPVTINTHWVHGHKGAIFLRTFYYFNGKLTPLNLILAALEEHQRRQDAKYFAFYEQAARHSEAR